MRLFLATLMIVASAFAQDTGITSLSAKLGQQLASRKLTSVAVLQFTNTQNFDPQLSAHLVDEIIRELGAPGKGLEVATRTKSDALLGELRLGGAPEINTKDLETIAARLHVDALVAGTFNAAGQIVAIDATIFDGKTSYIIGAPSAKLNRADLDVFLVERKGGLAPAVAIPAGMEIDVKLSERVDAGEARNGKTISATLENDVVVRNVLLAKKGSEVKLQASSPDGMELHIRLASMTLTDQRSVLLNSDKIIQPSTMFRPKNATGIVAANTPAQPKPGEAAQNAQFAFHLTQDVR